MTDRKRDPLPSGYQFGDAARVNWHPEMVLSSGRIGETFRVKFLWCSVHGWVNEAFADRHRNGHTGWNVIEGEHFDVNRDPGDETTQ